MSRFKTVLLAMGVGICLTLTAGPASAGNIVLTGHDDDLHAFYPFGGEGVGSAPSNQLKAMVDFARNGSGLKLLVFDSDGSGVGTGFQLASGLTALGYSYDLVNLNTAVHTAANLTSGTFGFDATKYSAMVVASVVSCGGCDIRDGDIAALLGPNSAAIAAFINAGGGVAQFAGAADAAAYSYLPSVASPTGTPPSSGFYQTADGLAAGIPAVNNDPTHNYFDMAASDPDWKVFEGNDTFRATSGLFAVTIGLRDATIDDGGGLSSTPVPAGMALAVSAFMSLGGYSLRRRKVVA